LATAIPQIPMKSHAVQRGFPSCPDLRGPAFQTSLNDLEFDEGESKFSSSNFSDFRESGGFVSFPDHL
jgi:hypothetical protein